jgi:hypothetical protein
VHGGFGLGKDRNRGWSIAPRHQLAYLLILRPARDDEWQQWLWMRDSTDSNLRFLWDRVRATTRADASDAGMAYPETGAEAALRRMQIWSNAASFHTFTATVNAADPGALKLPSLPADGGSIIWDDLNGIEETRSAVRQGSITSLPHLAVDSPFSANAVTRAGRGEQILYATRRVNRTNPHFANRTVRYTPQLATWFTKGARIFGPAPDGGR